jgi:serine/threonine protein kinase
MSHCANCGTEVTSGARYCTTCGTPVGGVVGGETTRVRPSAETIAAQAQGLLNALRKATLGEYEILGEIGRGGMAVVYLGHDIALDRKVAIKVMSPALKMMDPGVQERFHREARTAALLSHPHIIPVYAVKQTNDLVYFVMKFIVGRSLESVLKEEGPMAIPLIQAVLGQVGNALGHAHRHGVVHRDMKPGNVMLDEDGWVVVTDFGIAKVADAEALTQTGGMVGTPAYMSPEQCAGGDVTGASDQYSLGIMAYEMIAGHQPFTGGGLVSLIYDHCHTPPPPLQPARPDCPPEIAAAVMRMLAKDPAKRWPTIEQAVVAIGAGTETQSGDIKTHMMSLAQTGGTRVLLDKFKTPGSPVPRTGTSKPLPAGTAVAPGRDATARVGDATPPSPRRRSRLIWAAPVAAIVALGGAWLAFGPGRPGAPAPAPNLATADSVGQGAAQPAAPPAIPSQAAAAPSGGRATAGRDATAPAGSPPAPRAAARPAAPAPVASVAVEPATAQVTVGETVRLAAVARDAAGRSLAGGAAQWSTADSTLIALAQDGAVSGLAPGAARVTLRMGGRTAQALVTVTAVPVAALGVTPASGAVDVGGSLTLTATPRGASGRPLAGRVVTWQSRDPRIASVADGVVSGLAPGVVTISATSGGVSGSAEITVAAPASAPAAAPQPAPPGDARPEIERALETYRRAIESRDLTRLKLAYPGLTPEQAKAWAAFFANVTDLSAILKIEDLEVTGDRAQARVAATYEFRSGAKQTQQVEQVAVFERAATGWRLTSVK